MTGTSVCPLTIESGDTAYSVIRFRTSAGNAIFFGYRYVASDTIPKMIFSNNKGWNIEYTLLHSSNYNSYSPKLDGTGATGTWGISISGNAATATNADKLDGFRESDFSRHIEGRTGTGSKGYYKIGSLPASTNKTYDAFLIQGEIGSWDSKNKAVLNVCVSRRDGVTFSGYTQGLWNRNIGIDIGINDAGEIVLIVTGDYTSWTLDLHTIQGEISYTGTAFTPADTNFVLLSESNNVSKSLANGAVEKASKLATARTIWGQSFDGTGNVGGNLTGTNFLLKDGVYNPYLRLTDSYGTVYFQIFGGNAYMGSIASKSLMVDGEGNVGIGITSPSSKLHVNGRLRASSLTLDGTNLLEWDSDNSAWKFNGNLIATGFIASGDISAQAAALAEEEDRIAALEAQVAELQAEIENLKAQ